jgi:hypothetical protein
VTVTSSPHLGQSTVCSPEATATRNLAEHAVQVSAIFSSLLAVRGNSFSSGRLVSFFELGFDRFLRRGLWDSTVVLFLPPVMHK